ncbi:hypothetical protein [Parasulfitobacter algicola]|uniref:Uncharacterized protein n=1 Tax=Parasulfitobacter algicola TaxID=2614809 RepID=A0ABX2IPZ3_9RHOB|nr:hypothetical protein [Sulfitobacter algicola]NSX54959.1 hypothetical protein [Sulfitobacter algicola]
MAAFTVTSPAQADESCVDYNQTQTIDMTSMADSMAETFGPILAELIQAGKEDAIVNGVFTAVP